jgi:hypothetical protein
MQKLGHFAQRATSFSCPAFGLVLSAIFAGFLANSQCFFPHFRSHFGFFGFLMILWAK